MTSWRLVVLPLAACLACGGSSAASQTRQSADSPAPRSAALDSYYRAKAILDAGLEALGGETALRSIRSVERDMVFNWVDVGQQKRPWNGPADADLLPVGEQIPMYLSVDYGSETIVREEIFNEAPEDLFIHRDVLQPGSFFETGTYQQERPYFARRPPEDIEPRRRRELILLPEALLLRAKDRAASLEWVGRRQAAGVDENLVSLSDVDGQRIVLAFDAETHLLIRAEWVRDHPILGDTSSGVVFNDYRSVGPLRLPFRYFTTTGGFPARDHRVRAMRLDRAVSADRLAPPIDFVPIENPPEEPSLRAAGAGVYEILGPYNVMFAVFRDYVLLVEAPLDAAYTKKVLALIRTIEPAKPVRLVATHFHYDHVGGVRHAVAQDIPIWTTPDAIPIIHRALESRRTLMPDAYSISPRRPVMSAIRGRHVFDDGVQRVEIVDVGPTDHAEQMLVAWFPRVRTLLAADLWDVLNDDLPIPGSDAAVMMQRLAQRNIRVSRMVPVHGVPVDRAAIVRGFGTRWKYMSGAKKDAEIRALK